MKTKSKKAKRKPQKKWNWSDYSFKLKDKNLIEKSALTPVEKDGSRNFKGATTKKGQAHGPANANSMASNVAAGSSASATPGYGNSTYGFVAYGEAITRLEERLGGFVDGINDNDGSIAHALLEGYSALFDDNDGSKVILLGLQPSFRDYMTFDMSELVDNINNFRGKILNVFIGPESGFEDVDSILDWYSEIGISEDAIGRMTFMEKCASVCGYTPIESDMELYSDDFDYGIDYVKVKSLPELKYALSGWGECGITGCSELYMLGEIIYVLKKLGLDYQIDPVAAYTI